jgi:type II secretory pathway predicted ATPase ExeA
MSSLREVIEKHPDISYPKLAERVGIHKSTLWRMARKEYWPLAPEKEEVRASVERELLACGVAPEELEGVWEGFRDISRGGELRDVQGEETLTSKGVAMLDDEAIRHFGLEKDPFRNEISSARDVFISASHREIEMKMLEAAKYQRFLGVCGPVGSGKSLIWQKAESDLMEQGGFMVCMPQSVEKEKMHASLICDAMLRDFGGFASFRRSGEWKAAEVGKVLAGLMRRGKRCVLVLDEAHRYPDLTIKSLKTFHELQKGFRRLLGIIMLGQEELGRNLRKRYGIREVAARVEMVQVKPMKRQAWAYLEWKLRCAGGDPSRIFETDGAQKLVKLIPAENTNAIELNIVASHAMELAWRQGAKAVTEEIVEEAWRRLYV